MRLVVAAVALLCARAAAAHPLAPSLLELREIGRGRVEVNWKTPLLRPRGLDPAPKLPPSCRPLGPPLNVPDDNAVRLRWTVDCGPDGLLGQPVGVVGMGDAELAALVRVTLADGRVIEGVVTAAKPILTLPQRSTGWALAGDYIGLGIARFLGGLDHLLFVFGLVLLARTVRRVAATVTAFAVGHSVTLSLAVLGLIRVPTAPIEMLIAATILVLAAELAREPARPTLMRRYPWAMAAGFGLLHGLGFAAALATAGLPPTDVPLALFAFNVGIEIGQLAFVVAVLLVRRLLRGVPRRLPAWARQVPVYAMGTLAAFWCFERTAALFR